MKRRLFLKQAAGAVACALFIPAERLDFGVPSQRIVVPDERTWDYFRQRLTGEVAPLPSAGPLGLNHLKDMRTLIIPEVQDGWHRGIGLDYEYPPSSGYDERLVRGVITGVNPTLSYRFDRETGEMWVEGVGFGHSQGATLRA